MDPLSVAGSIAGLITLADAVFRGVYKYYQTASDASKEIKELAKQLQSFAGVLHSLGLLASTLDQNSTHSTFQMGHVSDATKLLGEVQARLNNSISKTNGSRIDNVQQSLKWPFTKTRTKELADNLVQQQQIMGLALQADSLGNLVKLLSNAEEVKRKLSTVQTGVENLQMLTRVEVNAERQRILDFFLKVNPQANLDTSRKLRHPGTGTWLTESPQFQQWIETAGSKMWLSGIPGAGKTVLAGAVIQRALERGKNSPKVGVAFFFCDYKDEKAIVLSNILGALVSQLARQNSKAFDKAKELYDLLHPSDGLTRNPDSDLLQDCFDAISKCFDQIILVVDGLDECGDNTNEVTEALAIVADYSTNVTMALASRDEYNIDLKLRDSFSKIRIGARKEDVLLYVASEIDRRVKDGTLRTNDVRIKDDILARLSQDADGMFRWVTCQLDYMCECPTDADRREALKELPPTLDATYERILLRIQRGHPRARKIVQKCLQLLYLKGIPWNMESFCHALSVPDALNVRMDESAMVTEADVSRLCSSFVRKSDNGSCFEFSHFTVREFLGRETLLRDDELAAYHLSAPLCYAAFCQQSLRYLQLRNFTYMPGFDNGNVIRNTIYSNDLTPFYVLAAFNWIAALRQVPQESCCLELARHLFDPRKTPSFICWAMQLCACLMASVKIDLAAMSDSLYMRASAVILDPAFRPIHLASALDLPEVCEYLLEVDRKWNTISMAGSPLECSIGGVFCLIGSQPQVPQAVGELSEVTMLGYATHRPGQVTTMLKTAGCVIQDPPKKLGEWSLMEMAMFSAIASLDFSPVSSLISMRWVISEPEAATFEKNMALMLQDYPNNYPQHIRHTQLGTSLLKLITQLNTSRVFESNHGFRMCVGAWTTAVKLNYDFIEDFNLMDTRITLSLDALIRKCEVAILNDDAEQMHRYLEDSRISGPETEDDGTKRSGYQLLRRAIINDSVQIGNSIWHLAASKLQCATLSALYNLAREEKTRALQMQNTEGFTPLTLAICASIELPRDSKEDQDATAFITSLLDVCGYDPLSWKCSGSPWHLAARSGSVAVIKCLKESSIPLDVVQQGQCTPLHVLNGLACKECVELMKTLFPAATSILYQSRTPLERYIYNCAVQHDLPYTDQKGVIESLAGADTPSNTSQVCCNLWIFFCEDIVGSLGSKEDYIHHSFLNIVPQILQSEAIESYEISKGQCAIIPLFSALRANRFPWVSHDELEMIICRSKFWSSTCLATETIEYVKFLIRRIAGYGQTKPIEAKIIHMLLDRGVSIHQLSGSASILEEACKFMPCGERDSPSLWSSQPWGLQRGVFEKIVKNADWKQLNASDPGTGRYHQILARRGYHYGSSWMIEQLVSKGLDPDKPRAEPLGDSFLTKCLIASATPAALTLLKLGADPMLRGSNISWNALHAAAERGQLEFLESLHSKFNASPIAFPWQETTNVHAGKGQLRRVFASVNALHLAALGGHLPILQFLIRNAIFPDAKSTTAAGYNCLHFAALHSSEETVNYLYSLGLDINQAAHDGSLPIHFAVRNQNTGAVQALVKLGSTTHADGLGMTPQMYAEELEYSEIRDLLLQCQNGNQTYSTDSAVPSRNGRLNVLLRHFETAIVEGDLETCDTLYGQGVPLNMAMPSCGGCSPLIKAIQSQQSDIIHWLLEKRVSVVKQGCPKHGEVSTLELAIHHEILLEHTWKILDICLDTAWDLRFLSSSIYRAVWLGYELALDLIIRHIRLNIKRYSFLTRKSEDLVLADMVNRPQNGTTPLHKAAWKGDLNMVKILLEAGADVDMLDSYNYTAIQLTNEPHIITELVAAGSKSGWLDPVSFEWAMTGHNYIARGCLSFFMKLTGSDWIQCSRNLSSIFYPENESIDPKLLFQLLQHGADLNRRLMNLHPDRGISPLCRAAAVDSLSVIDHCLEMGASIDFDGSSYGSALMAACANCRFEAVQYLVRRGASIVYYGELGLTSAIKMANGHKKIIQWLLVGQFTEQAKLEYNKLQDPNDDLPLRCWSGIQETSMRLTGDQERQPDESLESYVFRLSEIHRDMRGRALPLHQRDPLAGLFNVVRYRV
ncbi:hypothetical protein NPX13_g2797 [Xylaria arbuscula]|uniref:Nephrocystin 3-like N-terminal domain-containing protein n=1 Tax=Xylaria arbuscula TaxID=114810 RepID=A0A9W8TNE5_9PEZI|nr:hypothetical protein NPX13_g2797 [Xylaria arbuscula]